MTGKYLAEHLLSITYPLQEASLFTKVGDTRAIVMREHLVTEDRISDLRRMQQVHFQQACLEVSLFWLVVLQSVEEERRRRLYHILRHEYVNHLERTKSDLR